VPTLADAPCPALYARTTACPQARGWTRGVAAAFLAPFGLGDVSASTTCALGTRGDVIDDIYEKVWLACNVSQCLTIITS
jgi:hypothetical protein